MGRTNGAFATSQTGSTQSQTVLNDAFSGDSATLHSIPNERPLRPRLMANLMLPDGAEKHLEDWTIFFLNQTPFNTIAPVLALETPEDGHGEGEKDGSESKPELLYVLNLVRTKQDKSLPR